VALVTFGAIRRILPSVRPPLAVLVRSPAPAVAGADVEVPVRPEGELAAVVVRLVRVGDPQETSLGGRGAVGVRAAPAVLGDDQRAARVRVVDVETPVRPVRGVEGQAQEPSLPAARDPRLDVEEGRREERSGLRDDPDPASLLDHEQAARAVAGVGERDRLREPGSHGDEAQGDGRLRRRWRHARHEQGRHEQAGGGDGDPAAPARGRGREQHQILPLDRRSLGRRPAGQSHCPPGGRFGPPGPWSG
jgi:hypothetical protein